MDEEKDKNISVSRGYLGESTLTVSEHVAGRSEPPIESMAQIGQTEGSNAARGSSGEEDVMAEVPGSHVFVRGVCGNDSGDKATGEKILDDEEIRGCGSASVEVGEERDLRSLSGGDVAVGDSGATAVGVSVGELSSSHGLETVIEGPLVEGATGESERNTELNGGEGGGSIVDEIFLHENSVRNDEVLNRRTGTVEGSTADVGSTGGETLVVNVQDNRVAAGKEDMERGSAYNDVERDHEVVGGAGEARDLRAPSEENQKVVEEEDVRESENAAEKEQFEDSGQCGEMDADEEDACEDVEAQHLGILGDEKRSPGIQTMVAGSSAVVECSSMQKQVVDGAAVLVNEEGLNPKVDAPDCNAVEGITSNSEAKQILFAETDNGGAGKDTIVTTDSKLLGEQNPIAVSVDIAEMGKREFMCSTMEGTETDPFDENLSFSLEELQANIGRVDESTENHINVCADSPSFCQPIQVVGIEDAAMDENVHFDPENDQQGSAYDVAQVDSSAQQAMEIGEQVTSAELDGMLSCSANVQKLKDETLLMDTELETQVAGRGNEIPLTNNLEALNSNLEVQMPAENVQQMKLEERLDNSGMVVGKEVNDEMEVQKQPKIVENYRNVCSEPTSTGQQMHGVEVDDKVPSNLIVEVPHFTDLNGTLSFSGNEVAIAPNKGKEVLDSKIEGLETAEGHKSAAGNFSEADLTVGQEMDVEEQIVYVEHDALHEEQEMEVEEQDSDTEQPETIEEKFVKRVITRAGSSVKSHQATYGLLLEDEGEFYVSDLVWGKVRSHPWWPGQIYDPSDASEKAMKYHKKDCFLVAYFGDRTFAWVDESQLKPFYLHFSQIEKQSNSEVFQNAVSCALDEVCRRVELGLACPCIPKDAYDQIRLQIVENTGIQQESSVREGVDQSASAKSFQPDKLVGYMKALALSPSGGADRLDLVIAKAQLSSFYRLKGYCQLPEFKFCGGLVENGVDTLHISDKMHPILVSKDDEHIYSGHGTSETQKSSCNKRKHNLKDSAYPKKKERSLSELMSDSLDSLDDDELESDGKASGKLVSPSSGKKRKAVDFTGDDSSQDGRKTISLAKVSLTTHNIPKPSFKIGECIRRVASQMTGSPSILKSNSERLQKLDGDGSDVSFENFEDAEGKRAILPTDDSSLNDVLSQLHLAARDPIKGYSFFNIVISFFSDFRNSIISDRHSVDKVGGKRKKLSHSIVGSPEAFEFEDMSDTYWTDRVIQNGAEEQPSAPPPSTGRNTRGYQIVPVELKPAQRSRRSYSRKQYSDGNHDATPPKPVGYVDENSPAELIMNFSEVDTIPSETNLNKMFRRFGRLKESETEVDRETSRARVVFKRCCDAEVAHGSAAKFNIFGSMVVNYQLSYSISEPFRASPLVTSQGEEYAT